MARRKKTEAPAPAPVTPTGRLVDLPYVIADLGFASASTLYRLMDSGAYPQALKIGRNSRWRIEDHEKFKATLAPGKTRSPKSPGRPRKNVDDPLAA